MAAIDKFYGRPIAKPLGSGVFYKSKQIKAAGPPNPMANKLQNLNSMAAIGTERGRVYVAIGRHFLPRSKSLIGKQCFPKRWEALQ